LRLVTPTRALNTYHASLELDPRSGQWMADFEGLPVHTWGRSLGRVKEYAHEALAAHLDVPPTDVEGHIVFRTPKLPEPVLDTLDDAERARTEVAAPTPTPASHGGAHRDGAIAEGIHRLIEEARAEPSAAVVNLARASVGAVE
jgi:hypothetical protein